jgi:hypothetical protein
MFFFIIQCTILSALLIFLVHYLFEFFKSTMTVPKIKDLVKAPSKKYEEMFSLINQNKDKSLPDKSLSDKSLQKDELKKFLKSQINNSATSTSINDL